MISSNSEGNDEQFSGNELGESGGEESESIPEEKKFSGLELDELDVPPIPEEEDSKSIEGKYREKKRLSLCIAVGLCLFIGLGYLYLKWKISTIPLNQKEETSQVSRLTIPEAQLLIFSSFVIPFKEK